MPAATVAFTLGSREWSGPFHAPLPGAYPPAPPPRWLTGQKLPPTNHMRLSRHAVLDPMPIPVTYQPQTDHDVPGAPVAATHQPPHHMAGACELHAG